MIVVIDAKGLADEAMKGSKGKGESAEKSDPLEQALDELFSATGKDRVAAFYTIAGEKLFFQDPPDAVYSGRIWFTAVHVDLADEEDPVNLWTYEDLVIDYAAQLCLEDDELDATHLEKSVAKWEAKIRRKAKRRDRSGHASVRDVTGATLNLRETDRGRVP